MRSLPPPTRSFVATNRPLSHPPLLGAVLTGGLSRRFDGVDKATVIGPRVLSALRGAGIDPIVAVGGVPAVLGVPTIADRYPGEGPLGGVATALTYARTGWVLAIPCDLPLVAPTTIERLIAAIDIDQPDTAVVASVDGTPAVSLACWPANWASAAHAAIRRGERRFRHLLELGPIHTVATDARHVVDADDPVTLEALVGDQHWRRTGERPRHG